MEDTPIVVKSHDIHLDKEYSQWMYEIKERYRHTQVRTAVKINGVVAGKITFTNISLSFAPRTLAAFTKVLSMFLTP